MLLQWIVWIANKTLMSEVWLLLSKDSTPAVGGPGLGRTRREAPRDDAASASRTSLRIRDLDAISGLNLNLACRGDFVVKPQVGNNALISYHYWYDNKIHASNMTVWFLNCDRARYMNNRNIDGRMSLQILEFVCCYIKVFKFYFSLCTHYWLFSFCISNRYHTISKKGRFFFSKANDLRNMIIHIYTFLRKEKKNGYLPWETFRRAVILSREMVLLRDS